MFISTGITLFDVPAKVGSATYLDQVHDLQVLQWQSMTGLILSSMQTNNIRHFPAWLAPHPLR
jgi:hypothetical protein